jgi:hypothetical protein
MSTRGDRDLRGCSDAQMDFQGLRCHNHIAIAPVDSYTEFQKVDAWQPIFIPAKN